MQTLVAFRYMLAQGEGEGEDSSGKSSGPPARWQEWLDATQQGGKKMVPNPNHGTQGRFPQVSFSTALRDKGFWDKALEDYKKWLKQNPDDDKAEVAPASPPEEDKSHELTTDSHTIDDLVAKHGEKFKAILADMSKGVAAYEKTYMKPGFYRSKEDKVTADKLQKRFAALSPVEKALHVNGHKLGQYFQEHILRDKETHEEVMGGWRQSAQSDEAMELCGALKSLGVSGTPSPDDANHPERADLVKQGSGSQRHKAYIQECYNFTQAFFKHAGVKELTLYRGVKGQGTDELDEGGEIGIRTRQASSFTSDPMKTAVFGRGIEYKVPVEKVFASSMTYPGIGTNREAGGIGESEVVVMGASDLKGNLITPRKKG